MPTPDSDFRLVLQTLTDHGADFIVIGGVGAVLHGAPLSTFDVDVVHSRAAENLPRVLAALRSLDAIFRGQFGRRLAPEASHLASAGHQLLSTRAGPVDLLGTVTGDRGYEQLLPHTVEIELTGGLRVRVLDLPTLIALKEEAGRDKDKAALPVLRRTLEEKSKQ